MNNSAEGRNSTGVRSAKLKGEVYADSCLVLEEKRYFVAVKGVALKLSKTEFRILSCLVSRIDRITRLEDLWSNAWDARKVMNRKSIQVMVSKVRAKLAPLGLRVDSIVDVGYILSHDSCCNDKTGASSKVDD